MKATARGPCRYVAARAWAGRPGRDEQSARAAAGRAAITEPVTAGVRDVLITAWRGGPGRSRPGGRGMPRAGEPAHETCTERREEEDAGVLRAR